jgi:uncharacterized protein involved in exopolysaccharide biosynthesis
MGQDDMNKPVDELASKLPARPVKPPEANLLDILQILAENLRLLILGPLLIGITALGVSFLIPPTFTASTSFLPPQQQSSVFSMLQSLGSFSGLAGAAAGLKNPSDQYVSFLKSRTVQDVLIDRFKLMERYDKEYGQEARKLLEKNSKIVAGKDNIISVEFDDKDPKFAANVANGYVEELGSMLNRMAITEAQQRRVFFEKQLVSSKDNLIKAEQSLAASGVSVAMLNANPTTALEGPARLRAQVTAQEVKLAAMRSYLTDAAPEFRQAQAELNALRKQLASVEQEQPTGNGGNNDYIAKYREFKYQETLFDLFSKQYEVAKIDESRQGALIQVIDQAMPPELKSKPKKAFIAIGAVFISGFLLLVFVFIRHALYHPNRDVATAVRIARLRDAAARSLGRSR